MGFALENFDAIGTWRTTADGSAIDSSGAFPDGTKFEGVAGLRQFLLSRREQFTSTLTEKLLTYALGRRVEYYDGPAVRQIAREAAANDDRWSSIIVGIVKSLPFQMSRAGGATSSGGPRNSDKRRLFAKEIRRMIITKKAVSRARSLLALWLMGITVALPLLDAMVPALTAFDKTAAKPIGPFWCGLCAERNRHERLDSGGGGRGV